MTLVDEIKLLLEAPTMNANDVRTLLRRDHDEALQIARDMYESESGDERRALLRQLKPVLYAHTRAEEREVYDALQKLRDGDEAQDIAHEGYVEHGVLDDLLERMSKSRKTESEEWKAHAKVLLEILERHIEDEQATMFDILAEQFSDDQREAMGRRFLAAKARLTMKAKVAA
ncbi:MAG: hemerythrin domain-containing protein [Betaproteobacteria bacterium]